MHGTKRAQSVATWTTPQCPFTIAYVPQVLEDIRTAVVAAFHGLPHGGLEVGGILLGSQSAGQVTISDFRPLQCEHAFGPSFRLSANDHARLSARIAEAQADGQTVVGWFHSHTRTHIFLTEEDLEIQDRYFGDPRQVALVLKPFMSSPTLGGFFFREADGSIHSEESYQEFEVEGGAAHERQAGAAVDERGKAVMNVPAAQQWGQPPREAEQPEQAPQQLDSADPPVEEEADREDAVVARRANVLPPWELARMAALQRKSRGLNFHWDRVLAGAVIILVLGGAYFLLNRSDTEAQPTALRRGADKALGLRIHRLGGDLVLSWDKDVPDLLGATAGLLSIKDGAMQKEVGLNAAQLRSAIYLVSPESDRIEIQLTMLLPDQRTASEAGVVDLPPQASPAQVSPAQKSATRALPVEALTMPASPAQTRPAQTQQTKQEQAPPIRISPLRETPAQTRSDRTSLAQSKPAQTNFALTPPSQEAQAWTSPAQATPLPVTPAQTKPVRTPPQEVLARTPPARAANDELTIQRTVPARNYTAAQIRSRAEESKAGMISVPSSDGVLHPAKKAARSFVAPPDRRRAAVMRLTEEPPALKGIGPAERTEPLPLASLRTFSSLQPPPGSTPTTGSYGPVQVGGRAQPAELITRKDPTYPAEARARHLEGGVVLEGVVGANGRVKGLKVISGLPAFRQAALDAASQWVYKPALLNGKPIEAPMRVEFQFREGM